MSTFKQLRHNIRIEQKTRQREMFKYPAFFPTHSKADIVCTNKNWSSFVLLQIYENLLEPNISFEVLQSNYFYEKIYALFHFNLY